MNTELSQVQLRELLDAARNIQPWMTRIRHRLHQVPEPAFREFETVGFVAAELTELDAALVRRVGDTGIVAELDSRLPGPVVALRADMDALAVEEKTGAAYASRHPGWAHSCGHDGHMACLLGACRVLREIGLPAGKVRLLFQPAEEQGNGAKLMIEQGALEPLPAAIFSLHGWPGLDVGTIASRGGTVMAASDVWAVRLVGRGGHGARPQEANSPILGLPGLIEALAGMTGDELVVSPCVVEAGQAPNVIPDAAVVRGTMRTLSPQGRTRALEEMARAVARACGPLGLTHQITLDQHTPPVANDAALHERLVRTTRGMGLDFALLSGPSMGSEDFGFYLEKCPGVMFRLGMGKTCPSLHNSAFDFCDEALPAGAAMLAAMALEALRSS